MWADSFMWADSPQVKEKALDITLDRDVKYEGEYMALIGEYNAL
jgi:hypothetical protein